MAYVESTESTIGVDEGSLSIPGQTLAALGDLKNYLNYPSGMTGDDLQLLNLLAVSTDFIEREVGPVLPTAYVERYDGWGGTEIDLLHAPVISITYVYEYWSTGGLHVLAESTPSNSIDGYEIEHQTGMLTRVFQGNWPRTWFPGSRNIEVSYTAGYVTTPPVLWQACIEYAAHKWTQGHQQSMQAPGGGSIGGSGGYDAVDTTPGMWSGVPWRVKDALKQFRRPVIG